MPGIRKTHPIDKPYSIYTNNPFHHEGVDTWIWIVLQKHQKDDNKRYARWFCAVKSSMTHGSWEYGDCYVSDIKSVATEVYSNEDETYMIVTSPKGEKVDWEEIIKNEL